MVLKVDKSINKAIKKYLVLKETWNYKYWFRKRVKKKRGVHITRRANEFCIYKHSHLYSSWSHSRSRTSIWQWWNVDETGQTLSLEHLSADNLINVQTTFRKQIQMTGVCDNGQRNQDKDLWIDIHYPVNSCISILSPRAPPSLQF